MITPEAIAVVNGKPTVCATADQAVALVLEAGGGTIVRVAQVAAEVIDA